MLLYLLGLNLIQNSNIIKIMNSVFIIIKKNTIQEIAISGKAIKEK